MDMAHKLEQGIAEREADVARREAALEKREAEATMERAALRQLKHHLTEAEGGLTDTRRQLAEAREELETANELKQAAQIQALQAKQRADTAVGVTPEHLAQTTQLKIRLGDAEAQRDSAYKAAAAANAKAETAQRERDQALIDVGSPLHHVMCV